MKITVLIKQNLDKIYNILESFKTEKFLREFSKSIEMYDDKNWQYVFERSLLEKDKQIIVIDDNGYIPFLYFSKQKDVCVAFPETADAAKLARAHNDSRVCVIAYNNTDQIEQIMKAYTTTKFEGGRHAIRIGIMHNSFKPATVSTKFDEKSKTIVLCSDHAGYKVKESIKKYLIQTGHQVLDVGTHNPDSTHYSLYGISAGLNAKQCSTIIAVCFTGAGISNTLNKFKGINACICLNPKQALEARKTGANALAIAAKYIKPANIKKTVDAFLQAKPEKVNPVISKLGFAFDKKEFSKFNFPIQLAMPSKLK